MAVSSCTDTEKGDKAVGDGIEIGVSPNVLEVSGWHKGDQLDTTVTLHNISNHKIEIKNVIPSCECMETVLPAQTIPEHDSLKVGIKVATEEYGEIYRTVDFVTTAGEISLEIFMSIDK